MPIVSGNVSLYNETDGKPILPTPLYLVYPSGAHAYRDFKISE